MLRLTSDQRRTLIEKLPDAANAAMAGLVFGQFVAERPVSFDVALCGVALWALLFMCAMVLAGGSER